MHISGPHLVKWLVGLVRQSTQNVSCHFDCHLLAECQPLKDQISLKKWELFFLDWWMLMFTCNACSPKLLMHLSPLICVVKHIERYDNRPMLCPFEYTSSPECCAMDCSIFTILYVNHSKDPLHLVLLCFFPFSNARKIHFFQLIFMPIIGWAK